MAPITDETVQALRDTIQKLESRVQQLESKLEPSQGGPTAGTANGTSKSVQMILMGPPGAGISLKVPPFIKFLRAYGLHRQRNAGTQNKRQILCLSFGEPRSACTYLVQLGGSDLYPGNRRHVALSGCEKDGAWKRSQEDHGSRRACQR